MKWEYTFFHMKRILTNPPEGKGALDTFGAEGWELISVDEGWGYFKRPKESVSECISTYNLYVGEANNDDVTVTYVGKPCDCLSPEEVCG